MMNFIEAQRVRERDQLLMLMPFDSSVDLQVCAILIYRYTEFLVAALTVKGLVDCYCTQT